MFGLRMSFHYVQCGCCGGLWLIDPPADYSPFYPNDYYSFANGKSRAKKKIEEYFRRKRDEAYFGGSSFLGRLLASRYEDGALLSVSKLRVDLDSTILDVGCGSGKLLRQLAALGFRDLSGVDPFVSCDVCNGNSVRIRKCRLEELQGEKYDLVMFHHSLEHVPNPAAALRVVAQCLVPGGKCLVRVPLVACAWEQYGTNWVQLDPPRHAWVPTERCMRMLADAVGLSVENVVYDSTAFQFWGSELSAKGVPLARVDARRATTHFGRRKMAEFRARAAYLNDERRGDQCAFILASCSESKDN